MSDRWQQQAFATVGGKYRHHRACGCEVVVYQVQRWFLPRLHVASYCCPDHAVRIDTRGDDAVEHIKPRSLL